MTAATHTERIDHKTDQREPAGSIQVRDYVRICTPESTLMRKRALAWLLFATIAVGVGLGLLAGRWLVLAH